MRTDNFLSLLLSLSLAEGIENQRFTRSCSVVRHCMDDMKIEMNSIMMHSTLIQRARKRLHQLEASVRVCVCVCMCVVNPSAAIQFY
jgi:hypothetical protein